jgi:hypothetical protein
MQRLGWPDAWGVLVMGTERKKEEMAEKEPGKVPCPRCSSGNVRIVSRKDNFRPRLHTGNLRSDLTPISTTVNYKCQEQNCGHEWSETTTFE